MGFDIFKCCGGSKMEYAFPNVYPVEAADKRISLYIDTMLGLQYSYIEVQYPLLVSSHLPERLAEASGLRLHALPGVLLPSSNRAGRLSVHSNTRNLGPGSTKDCEMYRLDHRFKVDCGV
jgi:hypothetical protein